jgi:shikimate kinase
MTDRRIVIVGFMGCGKTTVAGALAQRLGCATVDLDSFITDREGRSPAHIIQEDGEPAFREVETRALQVVLQKNAPSVIALGGGAWTIEANRALVAYHDCRSVWLDAPFEVCWERILSSSNTIRPMAPDRDSARKLYNSRRRSYGLTELRIEVSDNTTAEALSIEIQRRVKIRNENA